MLITSILVISETYTWLRYHKGSRPAAIFLKILNDGIELGDLTVIYPNHDLCENARTYLQRYHDQKISYTDALSFALLNLLKSKDVFGFDSHFYIIGCNLWPIKK